jgi:orotate phosphoribosyltransferase
MKTELLNMVRELSYTKGTVTLVSGKTSDFYVDMKHTLLHPKGISLVAHLMLQHIESQDGELAGVGGMTMGADPISTATSLLSLSWGRPLNAFYIRKEPKGHGTEQWVEGLKNFSTNDKVYILEDVVTTGGSSLKAVGHARDAGLDVQGILTCVDREEGGREKIETSGVKFHTLLTKSEIVG